jgi:hypothetical protein
VPSIRMAPPRVKSSWPFTGLQAALFAVSLMLFAAVAHMNPGAIPPDLVADLLVGFIYLCYLLASRWVPSINALVGAVISGLLIFYISIAGISSVSRHVPIAS